MTQIGVVQYKHNQNNAYNEFENIIIDRFDDMKWKLEILLILKVKYIFMIFHLHLEKFNK